MVGSASEISLDLNKIVVIAPPGKQNWNHRVKGAVVLACALAVALTVIAIAANYEFAILQCHKSEGAAFLSVLGRPMTSLFSKNLLAIKCSIVAGLVLGTGAVLYHVTHSRRKVAVRIAANGKPIIEEAAPGKFIGTTHIRAELRWREQKKEGQRVTLQRSDALVDISALDSTKSGTVPIYENQPVEAHTYVSTMTALAALPYAAVSIAYNVVRLVVIPFYILGCLLYEKATKKYVFSEEEKFKPHHILREMAYSIKRIVKAIFYGLALFCAALYSLFSPINGRKLATNVELSWNYNENEKASTPQHRGIIYGILPKLHWKWEGGGSPSHLGANGGTLILCRQPIAWAEFSNGQITRVTSRSGHLFYAMALEHRAGIDNWDTPRYVAGPEKGDLFAIHERANDLDLFANVPSLTKAGG